MSALVSTQLSKPPGYFSINDFTALSLPASINPHSTFPTLQSLSGSLTFDLLQPFSPQSFHNHTFGFLGTLQSLMGPLRQITADFPILAFVKNALREHPSAHLEKIGVFSSTSLMELSVERGPISPVTQFENQSQAASVFIDNLINAVETGSNSQAMRLPIETAHPTTVNQPQTSFQQNSIANQHAQDLSKSPLDAADHWVEYLSPAARYRRKSQLSDVTTQSDGLRLLWEQVKTAFSSVVHRFHQLLQP